MNQCPPGMDPEIFEQYQQKCKVCADSIASALADHNGNVNLYDMVAVMTSVLCEALDTAYEATPDEDKADFINGVSNSAATLINTTLMGIFQKAQMVTGQRGTVREKSMVFDRGGSKNGAKDPRILGAGALPVDSADRSGDPLRG